MKNTYAIFINNKEYTCEEVTHDITEQKVFLEPEHKLITTVPGVTQPGLDPADEEVEKFEQAIKDGILWEILESAEMRVTQFNDGDVELCTWTNGGVNEIISPEAFTPEAVIEEFEAFDIDEEIEVNRQDQRYRDAFTITQSVHDFAAFKMKLQTVTQEIKDTFGV